MSIADLAQRLGACIIFAHTQRPIGSGDVLDPPVNDSLVAVEWRVCSDGGPIRFPSIGEHVRRQSPSPHRVRSPWEHREGRRSGEVSPGNKGRATRRCGRHGQPSPVPPGRAVETGLRPAPRAPPGEGMTLFSFA